MKLVSMSGKNRKIDSFIEPIVQKIFVKWMVPKIPKFIETYHLTLLTIPLSLLIIFIGKLAQNNSYFFLLHGLIILIQYISDILDGSLGRYRNTGLIRWGFFTDHFLDFVFANAIVLSYALAFSINVEITAVLLFLVGGFFMHEFLIGNIKGIVNVTGYYGIGPTETRLGIIILDFLLAISGFYPNVLLISSFMTLALLVLLFLFFKTQKSLWHQDMNAKKSK